MANGIMTEETTDAGNGNLALSTQRHHELRHWTILKKELFNVITFMNTVN
jgi:hypothetical protein